MQYCNGEATDAIIWLITWHVPQNVSEFTQWCDFAVRKTNRLAGVWGMCGASKTEYEAARRAGEHRGGGN